jgi:hypothetical protein
MLPLWAYIPALSPATGLTSDTQAFCKHPVGGLYVEGEVNKTLAATASVWGLAFLGNYS